MCVCVCVYVCVVQEARAQNERKRQRDSPAALESRMRASPPARTPQAVSVPVNSNSLSTAESLKEQGNTALKQGNLQQAMHVFSMLWLAPWHVSP